ncbi:LytR family transcriptional regulator [Lactobacillus sp. S2-2]|uniref:LCP family glycopolymer transferase n=1 Tax=Lactobacillus sp. S2-2 TaxID=2692917 RepID=UPI001F394FE5|nr:LCP family protein [Lactobacillus sp. S2-2]MCF6515631.1 LytR family transcriptional regulator [Lactobacillus sp. S2-2]
MKNNKEINNRTEKSNLRTAHHPIIWTFQLLSLLIVIVGLGLGYNRYQDAKSTFSDTYDKTSSNKIRNASSMLNNKKPFSILLLGTDTGALGRHDTGRTDTIMVATVNPKKETTYLTSIPRDTRVSVKGDQSQYEKINAAYTIGGADSAMQTVEDLLDIPLDFYAIVNMGGLEKMVNAVGGVTVKSPLTFSYGHASVVKGKATHLNGKQALDYSRMRYDDPKGDYGRQARQRQVLQKLVMKGLNISSITRTKEILTSLNGNLKTDMSFEDMTAARANYGEATHHIKSETLQCDDAMIDGISYQIAPDKELKKVSNHIRKTLNLKATKKFTTDAQNNSSNNNDSYNYNSNNSYNSTSY